MVSSESQDTTELRTDSLLDRCVLFAEGRARRPNEFADASKPGQTPRVSAPPADCPFCPGEESQTPPTVYETNDMQGDWQLRVVANKYPAVITLGDIASASPEQPVKLGVPTGEMESRPAWGAHEVVIETRRHVQWMGDLEIEELRRMLAAYRNRLKHWRKDRRLKYGLIFKNAGASSGASLAHLHSQFIALGEVPPVIAREVARAEIIFSRHGACASCEMIKSESEFGGRVVHDTGKLIAYCPYASLQPFETWVMPTEHRPAFEASDDNDLDMLAELLLEVFRRIERIAKPAGYNVLLRTAPWCQGVEPWCHWRLEILPRTAAFAGFELATGMAINHLFPEQAAKRLRQGSIE